MAGRALLRPGRASHKLSKNEKECPAKEGLAARASFLVVIALGKSF